MNFVKKLKLKKAIFCNVSKSFASRLEEQERPSHSLNN